jgi:hypothetical protein
MRCPMPDVGMKGLNVRLSIPVASAASPIGVYTERSSKGIFGSSGNSLIEPIEKQNWFSQLTINSPFTHISQIRLFQAVSETHLQDFPSRQHQSKSRCSNRG